MKIAQIAPLFESVPPKFYGGTERVVSYLTEDLVRRGHEVTLFASGDSITSAELVAGCDQALRLHPTIQYALPYQLMALDQVMQRADEFDVLHFHIDLLHFPFIRYLDQPTVTTLHGRIDGPDLVNFFNAHSGVQLVAISEDQGSTLPATSLAGVVYNGLPEDLLPFKYREPGNYLAFLGRISPDKGPERAIEIAARSGLQLKIAAKVDPADRSYWEQEIEPLLRTHSNVEYVGEIDERQKAEFLGQALGLIFPIKWREPFGLVLIEAMACGCPVVAWPEGAVAEVIEEGVSGQIVNSIEAAVAAVGTLSRFDRAQVRRAFERRFTAERMADGYLEIYRGLLKGQRRHLRPAATAGNPDIGAVA
jgi:glycosyltransferase involved in cell wall biosynthesis